MCILKVLKLRMEELLTAHSYYRLITVRRELNVPGKKTPVDV